MDIAFSHILHWQPSQITEFIKEAHNTIKGNQDEQPAERTLTLNPLADYGSAVTGENEKATNGACLVAQDSKFLLDSERDYTSTTNKVKVRKLTENSSVHTEATKQRNEVNSEAEIKKMKKSLEADKNEVFSAYDNWGEVLEKHQQQPAKKSHFKILTTYVSSVSKQSKANAKDSGLGKTSSTDRRCTSIVHLLRIMRNKCEHYAEFSEDDRKELGWSADEKAREANPSLFVQYWAERFPKLFPYLWLKFYEFREKDTLRKFYKLDLDAHLQNRGTEDYPSWLLFDMSILVGHIYQALFYQVEKGKNQLLRGHISKGSGSWQKVFLTYNTLCSATGGLTARYSATDDSKQKFTLEFRSMPLDLQNLLLVKCVGWRMEITLKSKNQAVCLQWIDRLGNVECISYQIKLHNENVKGWNETVSLIATIGTPDAEDKIFTRLAQSNDVGESRRVIHLTNRTEVELTQTVDMLSKILNIKFVSNPVNWNDLKDPKRGNFHKELSTFEIRFQNYLPKLGELFPENDDERNELFKLLTGEELNSMLSSRCVTLLGKHHLPSLSNIYIERNVWERSIIDAKAMKASPASQIFVITNNDTESLEKIFDNDAIVVLKSSSGFEITNKHVKFYLLEETIRDSNVVFSAFRGLGFAGKNIHILSHIKGNTFEWLNSTHFLLNGRDTFLTHMKKMSEEGMLESLKDERIILIADSPGMGKSQVLTSFATRLLGKRNHVVIILVAHELLEQLSKSSNFNKDSIINTIVELTCSTNLDKKIVSHLIKHLEEQGPIKLEIMIDGLDEIRNELHKTNVLHDMLKVINNDFSFMRTWFTLRDHMLHEIWEKCGNCMSLKIEPFSEIVQEKYLTDFWLNKMDSCTKECYQIQCNSERYSKYWLKKTEIVQGTQYFPPTYEEFTKFATQCVRIPLSENDREIAGTPLICRILAEIYERQALSGNFVLENPDHSFASLYEQMVDRKLECFLTEKLGMSFSGKVRTSPCFQTLRNEMDNFHTYIALKIIFSDEIAEKFRDTLVHTQDNWDNLHSRVLAQGIVKGLNPHRFIHMTFAEYFVELFVCKVLKGHILDNIKANDDPKFDNFLFGNVLATSGENFERVFKLPTLCQIVNSVCGRMIPHGNQDDILTLAVTLSSFITLIHFNAETVDWSEVAPWFLPAHRLKLFALQFALFQCNVHRSAFHIITMVTNVTGRRLTLNDDFFVGPLNKSGTFPINRSVLEHRDKEGRTPLLMLLQSHGVDKNFAWKVEYLVNELGADVNAVDKFGYNVLYISPEESPLHLLDSSAQYWPYEIETIVKGDEFVRLWKLFMRKGFTINADSINARNNFGDTPLFKGVRTLGAEALPLIQFAKDHGADFNIKYGDGRTLLHYAIDRCQRELVSELINFGADASVVDEEGDTPLMRAIQTGNVIQIIKMLIDAFPRAVHIKSGNEHGRLPLHAAVFVRKIEIVKMLVGEYNADLNAKDSERTKAIEYDTEDEICEYLESKTAKVP